MDQPKDVKTKGVRPMGKPEDDQREGIPLELLANKYRVSWQQASEAQRKAICTRFSLQYTQVNDELLLREVAKCQQTLYVRSKENRKLEKTS